MKAMGQAQQGTRMCIGVGWGRGWGWGWDWANALIRGPTKALGGERTEMQVEKEDRGSGVLK